MANFALITKISNKKGKILAKVLYIYYLLCFQNDRNKIQALINSDNKVNTIRLAYGLKLGFKLCQISLKA